jgi:hypothetical protein
MSQSNPRAAQDFIFGILIAIGLNFLIFPAAMLGLIFIVNTMVQWAGLASNSVAFTGIVYAALYGFPLWQLSYQVPIMQRFRQQGRPERVKGMFVGVILSILLFGGCNILIGLMSSPPPSLLLFIIAVSIGLPLIAAAYLFKRQS